MAAAVALFTGCSGGSHTYRASDVKRAFAAQGIPVETTTPLLNLFQGVKSIRAVLVPVRLESGECNVVIFTTEKEAKAYDSPRGAALAGLQIGRARNVVVTYDHVTPKTERRIKAALDALR